MYISEYEVITKESIDLEIATLGNLIQENKINEIKKIVEKAKAIKGFLWYRSDKHFVQCAVRDAILLGQIETVQFFLEEGLPPNAHAYYKGNSGYTCSLISFAAESGSLPLVKLLVEKEADIRPYNSYFKNGDDSAIKAAVVSGHASIVDYLLEHGAKVNGLCGGGKLGEMYGGTTFLAKAAQDRNKSIVESLLKHGASIESALRLAHEKFKHYYRKYISDIEYSYSEERRKDNLQGFDQEKHELEKERDKIKSHFESTVKALLDYAFGMDFPIEKKALFSDEECSGLSFLKEIDISGFNLVGISIEGCPVTHEMLFSRKIKGADKALVTFNDITSLADVSRREALIMGLENCIRDQGYLINNDNIINLVPLWRAAQIGDVTAVKTRLNAGVDPNNGISKNNIPLILAAQNGHLDIVKILVEHIKINKKNIIKAIEVARKGEHEATVIYLSNQQDVNAIDEESNALLHKAIINGNLEQVQTLISKGAEVNLKNKNGETPLLLAASLPGEVGSMLVELLLTNKANANQYRLPLSAAVKEGNVKSVELLIPFTEKTEKDDFPWYMDLMFDAMDLDQKNKIKILTLLKINGADFNTKNQYGETLLNKAIRSLPSFSNFKRSIRDTAFFTLGCENRLSENFLEQTTNILIEQSKKYLQENLTFIDFLLDNDANPSLGDSEGYTPLHVLIKELDLHHLGEAYISVLDRLFQRRVNVNAKTKKNITPLHEAADTGDLLAVEYLIKNGASINAQTKSGRTALHCAAAHSFSKTAEFLIRQGASVDIVDFDGLTPLELSKKAQKQEKNSSIYNSYLECRDHDNKFLQMKKILTKNYYSKFDLAQIKANIDFYVDKLAEFPVQGPKLVRKVIVPNNKSDIEIKNIIEDLFKGSQVLENDKDELLEDLRELNKIAQMDKEKFNLRDNSINYNANDIANMVCIVTLQAMSDKQEQQEHLEDKAEILEKSMEEASEIKVKSAIDKQTSGEKRKFGFFKETDQDEIHPEEKKVRLLTQTSLDESCRFKT